MTYEEYIAVSPQIIDNLKYNGTYIPPVTRVIYNVDENTIERKVLNEDGTPSDQTEKVTYKTLATVVYFKDGTKVSVVNSEHDGLTFDENGYASDQSKEVGLVYAVVKRLYGTYNEDKPKIIDGNGLTSWLRKTVKDAYDQNKEMDARIKAKKEAKIRHEKLQADAALRREAKKQEAERIAKEDEVFARLARAIVNELNLKEEANG